MTHCTCARHAWDPTCPAHGRHERHWTHGWPLLVALFVLAALPIFNVFLGQLALGGIAALWLLTLTSVKQHAAESTRRSNPGRRQGRPSRETAKSES